MKILCSDYDGTLTRGGLDAKKYDAIHAWREKGNRFGIISGRGARFYSEVTAEHPLLEVDFVACCNGGVILDHNGAVIYETHCKDVSLHEIAKILFSWGCPAVFINGIDNECDQSETENK